jgi:hypothetical protein
MKLLGVATIFLASGANALMAPSATGRGAVLSNSRVAAISMDGQKRGDASLSSHKINLWEQQQAFEKGTVFKSVSPTVSGLEEKGYLYDTGEGFKFKKVEKKKKGIKAKKE